MITSEEAAKDLATAEAVLARHGEHKAEIDARENTFKTFHEMGKGLISKKHFASEEVCCGCACTSGCDTLPPDRHVVCVHVCAFVEWVWHLPWNRCVHEGVQYFTNYFT